ncbi:hypothetical protein [Taklimakanibacter deserti]|uniref:hypothetical protein n=1 Tax=Taklimakanibacter deserti TaxID=2267839 RepID=UPI0013C4AE34
MKQLSKLNLDDDFAAALRAEDAGRWELGREGDLEVWITLSPGDHPEERFTARLLWNTYPGDLPPSVLFVDPTNGSLGVPSAWPIAAGFRPPNDICATWTAEGYVAHPEWVGDKSKRLIIRGNVLLLIIRILQDELDRSFAGRFRQ